MIRTFFQRNVTQKASRLIQCISKHKMHTDQQLDDKTSRRLIRTENANVYICGAIQTAPYHSDEGFPMIGVETITENYLPQLHSVLLNESVDKAAERLTVGEHIYVEGTIQYLYEVINEKAKIIGSMIIPRQYNLIVPSCGEFASMNQIELLGRLKNGPRINGNVIYGTIETMYYDFELGRINYKKHEIMCATKQTHAVFSTLQPKDFVYVSGHLQYIVKFNKDLNRSVVQTSTMPHLIVRLSK